MNNKTQLLFVDDEANILQAVMRLFRDNYEVYTAASGREGLELLNGRDGIGVVIADYRMPGMNGAEFLHRVSERRPEAVRILMSGYADLSTVIEAINKGNIYRFIPIPWNEDELRMTVANAVERFSLSRQNDLLRRQLQDKNAELLELNAILRERITEEVASLKKLNDDLMQGRVILEALPYAVVRLDPDGYITFYNQKTGDLFSWGADEKLYATRGKVFGRELNGLIDLAARTGHAAGRVRINETEVRARCVRDAADGEYRGIILVLEAAPSAEEEPQGSS